MDVYKAVYVHIYIIASGTLDVKTLSAVKYEPYFLYVTVFNTNNYIYINAHTLGQKYKTTLKNEEKDIVYNLIFCRSAVSFDNLKNSARHTIN